MKMNQCQSEINSKNGIKRKWIYRKLRNESSIWKICILTFNRKIKMIKYHLLICSKNTIDIRKMMGIDFAGGYKYLTCFSSVSSNWIWLNVFAAGGIKIDCCRMPMIYVCWFFWINLKPKSNVKMEKFGIISNWFSISNNWSEASIFYQIRMMICSIRFSTSRIPSHFFPHSL